MTSFLADRSGAEMKSSVQVRIPTQSGRVFRFDAGRDSDLNPATIPN
jgi:hypothetical protein